MRKLLLTCLSKQPCTIISGVHNIVFLVLLYNILFVGNMLIVLLLVVILPQDRDMSTSGNVCVCAGNHCGLRSGDHTYLHYNHTLSFSLIRPVQYV